MQKHILKNVNGSEFLMRLIRVGDAYGRDNCLVNDSGADKVEFFDRDYDFDKDVNGAVLGQFTGGRYYVKTFLSDSTLGRGAGFSFDNGVAKWSLDESAYQEAREVLAGWVQ